MKKLFIFISIILIFLGSKKIYGSTQYERQKQQSTFYFACSGYHGLIQGYCREFSTYDSAKAELANHKTQYPDHTDVSASGGKCPF